MTALVDLHAAYGEAKDACSKDWAGKAAGHAIIRLAALSLRFLESQGSPIDLVSRVRGKEYISYRLGSIVARPANRALFIRDEREVSSLWESWEENAMGDYDLARMSYTVALAPCLAMELADRQNKKGPATYFECLIGHLFARTYGRNPERSVALPVHGRSVRMTMDFLFGMGTGRANVHLAVKMSTRERVVQAWAHQRLLNSAYGEGVYKGILVVSSETKMDSRSLEVVEICLPDQWLAYQTLLARMDRIYYFDVPARYQALTNRYPEVIQIRQFGEFFREAGEVVG
jgi:hypothetical protein